MFVACVDFGGTKLMTGIVTAQGEALGVLQAATPRSDDPAVVARDCAALLRESAAMANVPLARCAALGSTVPGLARPGTGTLVHAPAQGWRDVPWGGLLREATGLPVRLDNDVNACALAEVRFGGLGAVGGVLWVTVSTGVGGALVLGGRLHAGAHGYAGEVGHLRVTPEGPRCACGRTGCVEAYASGPAIARRARGEGLTVADARDVFELAWAGNASARRVIAEAEDALAFAFGQTASLLDLDTVVVGGGVAASLDLARVREGLAAHTILPPEALPDVRLTTLGERAGLMGAAAVALDGVAV